MCLKLTKRVIYVTVPGLLSAAGVILIAEVTIQGFSQSYKDNRLTFSQELGGFFALKTADDFF